MTGELERVIQARRGIGSPLSSIGALGASGFAFRSNFTPEVLVQPGLSGEPVASTANGSSSQVLEQAQPTVEALLPDGSRLVVFAPYGEAHGDYRIYVGGVLVAVAGSLLLALAVAYTLGYRRGRRR